MVSYPKIRRCFFCKKPQYSSKSVEEIWKTEWGRKIYYSHGTNHSNGVVISFKPNLDFEIESIIADKNGRYLLQKK